MTLPVTAYTTLDIVKAELECGDRDVLLERAILEAGAALERLTGRPLYYQAARVERAGMRSPSPFLQVWQALPIVSITSIAFDGADSGTPTTVDADAYEVADAAAGMIRRRGGSVWSATPALQWGPVSLVPSDRHANLYTVTYAGGYVTPLQAIATEDDATPLIRSLPYDVERGVIDFVRMRVAQAGAADPTVRSISFDRGSITWAATAWGGRVQVPETLAEVGRAFRFTRAI